MFKLTKYIGPGRVGHFQVRGTTYETPTLIEEIKKSGVSLSYDINDSKADILIINEFSFGYTTPAEFVESVLFEASYVRKNYPNILLGISIPLLRDIESTYSMIRRFSDFDILVLHNIHDLLLDSKAAAQFLIDLRTIVPQNQLICMPGVATPNVMSFLAFFGVDLFDTSFAKVASSEKMSALTQWYVLKEGESSSFLYQKSLEYFTRSLDEFKTHLSLTTIYEYIESIAYTDSTLYSILKRIYIDYSGKIEQYAPIRAKRSMFTDISFYRPHVLRYIDRVSKISYIPTDCVLLLPCTAKKPYSKSKTIRTIQKHVPHFHDVQKFVLTSPLGVVPFQLEKTYPANSYDISVTGMWSYEEKERLISMLHTILSPYKSKKILAHVTGPYVEVCNSLKGYNLTFTATDGLTAPRSIDLLNSELKSIKRISTLKDDYLVLFSYQFGCDGSSFFRGTKIVGTFSKRIIDEDNVVLATLDESRGLFSLTLEGAKRVSSLTQKFDVNIDFEFTTNTLFSVGVDNASDDVRIGDEVIIKRNNTVVGVGVAAMPGAIMKISKTGIAVRLRHK